MGHYGIYNEKKTAVWFFRSTFLYRTCRIYRIRWKSLDVINMPETEKAASCDGFWGRKSMLWITSDSETRNDKRSHKTSHIQEIVSKSIPLVAISSTSTVITCHALKPYTEAPVLKRRNILPCHGSLDFHSQVYPKHCQVHFLYYHPPHCFLSVSGFFWVFCKWKLAADSQVWVPQQKFPGAAWPLGGFQGETSLTFAGPALQKSHSSCSVPKKINDSLKNCLHLENPQKRLKTGWFNFLRKNTNI